MNRRLASVLPSALIASLVACGIPRDPEGTLDRVRHGTLRVGATHSDGWVRIDGPHAQPLGCEPDLVRALAGELSAEVKWTVGAESELLRRLRHHELDLVVGGLVADTPWKPKIGLTDPFAADVHGKHVLAVPPGENAWAIEIERTLRAWRDDPSRWPEACP